jgi:hypothetical protein
MIKPKVDYSQLHRKPENVSRNIKCMNRIRISKNLLAWKYLIIAFQFYLTYYIFLENINNQSRAALAIVVIICGLFLYLFQRIKNVEFDDDYMYVSTRKKTEVIPLEKVHKIKITMTSINNYSLWKIGYRDEMDNEKAVRIIPKAWSGNFERFMEIVKLKNDNVNIKNWTHSFDLDQ